MRHISAVLLLGLTALAACGDDDGDDLGAFCADFEESRVLLTDLPSRTELGDALTFFQELETSAPSEIDDEVTTVTDGLESLATAFDQAGDAEGEGAIEAVEQAADVNLEELAQAAEAVGQYATDNCENVSADE